MLRPYLGLNSGVLAQTWVGLQLMCTSLPPSCDLNMMLYLDIWSVFTGKPLDSNTVKSISAIITSKARARRTPSRNSAKLLQQRSFHPLRCKHISDPTTFKDPHVLVVLVTVVSLEPNSQCPVQWRQEVSRPVAGVPSQV